MRQRMKSPHLWPNPTSAVSYLTLGSEWGTGSANLVIRGSLGQRVYLQRLPLSGSANTFEIPVDFELGEYTVSITSGNQRAVKRLIVQ